jgi:curved DNA-binding protein CbpA
MTRVRLHSHYDTLQVDRGAPAEDVRSAYRRLAQKFHPDKHQGRAAAALVMAQLNQAYEVLSDPAQRDAYDDWLAREDARAGTAAARGAVFTPDRFGWGGWLVFATTSLAVLTVGYVVIATWSPTASLARATAAQSSPAAIARPSNQTTAARRLPSAPVQPSPVHQPAGTP